MDRDDKTIRKLYIGKKSTKNYTSPIHGIPKSVPLNDID